MTRVMFPSAGVMQIEVQNKLCNPTPARKTLRAQALHRSLGTGPDLELFVEADLGTGPDQGFLMIFKIHR